MSSDDEDNQSLIDEIQALENVLDQKQALRSSDYASTSVISRTQVPLKLKVEPEKELSYQNDNFMDVDENLVNDRVYENYSCEDLQDLLDLNKKLIESILAAHEKMVALLDECTKNQRIVEEQINKYTSCWPSKIVSFNAGMPYFKDKNYFTPKKNEDTQTKVKNGELRLTELQRIQRWNQGDKSNLLKAIRHEVTLTLLDKNQCDDSFIDNSITKVSQLPFDVKKAIGSLGSMKFDWLKIANNMLESKHSAEECEVMWNVFLHPDINKLKWTTKEDKNLNYIVEEHDFEDWDSIAKQLNTKRSGYQCFVRYNTNNWKNLMKGQTWSTVDDKNLFHLVTRTKIGDYIPWGFIASCMINWTKQQVYFRWIYSLAPHLKKGKFSEEEDKTLLDAVEKYGQNFSKISALVMNNRTNIQLKEHYKTIIHRNENCRKVWTVEEDSKLFQLHKKYGPNWARIVKEMPNISRIQARQRHASLLRYSRKGVRLDGINRDEIKDKEAPHTTVTYTSNTPWSRENKEIYVKYLKIDDQLINFFKKENMIRKLEERKKSYHPQKLQEDTTKVYEILSKLCANISIPEYIDDSFELNEMQHQLVVSVQEYMKEKKISCNEKIEEIRLQMFGPQEPLPENQRFIPPLPFGFYVKETRTKHKISNKIEYTHDNNILKYQIKPDMELEPNKYVIEYLGEDTENQFEKLKKIMIENNFKKPNRVYSLKCKPFANKVFFEEDREVQNYTCTQPAGLEEMTYDWHMNRMVSSNTSREKVIVEDVPLSLIEPNKTTLQAYQELVLISSTFPSNSEETNADYKLTSRGREALYLFKRRYTQLFHMPTGLSRMIPPDVVDESAFLPTLEKIKKKNKAKRSKKVKNVNTGVSLTP